MPGPAQLVITNADIITINPAQPRASGVAVADGRIVAVGPASDVAEFIGIGTDVVDFGGGVLTPGLVEAHGHLLPAGLLLAPQIVDIRSFMMPSWDAAARKLRAKIAATPPGDPIIAYGLDPLAYEVALPTVDVLDAFTTAHPLLVITHTAHTAAANSAALAFGGITAGTPDPPGGSYGRHDDGSLDGLLHEAPAVEPFIRSLFEAIDFDLIASIRHQAAALARAGYTTNGELLVAKADLPVLQALREMPDLPLRIRYYEATTDDLKPFGTAGQTDPKVRQVGVKIWADGSPLEGKSLHFEPFLDTPVTRSLGLPAGCCGAANYTRKELLTFVRVYAGAGLQFAAHTQGDQTTEWVLDAYETVLREQGLLGTDHRWRLEHVGGATKAQFERAKRLGITVSMFPRHVYYFSDCYVNHLLGEERGSHWMRLRSAIDAGQTVSLHNDGYFTPPEPISSVHTAVNRLSKTGQVRGIDEAITVDEGLRAITINAAWHLFSEHEIGSIEVGKFADFTELSADPYAVDPAKFDTEVTVLGTWINGTRVNPEALEV